MSRIYFRTEHEGVAEVSGSERAYASLLSAKIAESVVPPMFGCKHYAEHPVARYLPPSWRPFNNHADAFPSEVVRTLEGRLTDVSVEIDGVKLSGWSLIMNTALRLGSDPVRLLTRLHGACEIHTWVEGPNRAWLADIIDKGRKSGVLRGQMGWEDVAMLLRLSDAAPVVTSYSVCESFPNRTVAEWVPPHEDAEPQDLWSEVPRAEQWVLGLTKLREHEAADPSGRLELKPETWEGFSFSAQVSILDLVDRDFQARLAARFAKAEG